MKTIQYFKQGWGAIVMLLVLVTGASCSKTDSDKIAPPPEVKVTTLVDGANRTINISAKPARIVSLSPAATDILVAENAQTQMVGATRFCRIPTTEESHVTRLGGMVDPDYERLVTLQPDLVIIPWLVDKTMLNKLVAMGLPVLVLHPESLAGVLADLRMIGAATGHAAAGEAKAKGIETVAAVAASRWQDVPAEKHPRVLIYMDDISPAPGAYVDDLLTAAGGRNVLPPGNKAWVEVAPENALQLAPDIIINIPAPGTPTESSLKSALLKSINTVTLADGAAFYHPGPDMGIALWALARAIAPVKFPESSPPQATP